jgi:prepilin-type N-terminal cleavage/methylation domain-containing protein
MTMKLLKRPREKDSGFSMVELLVTMLLLTIALVGLAALQLYSVRQVGASQRANEATRLAQSVIERYMTLPLASIPATGGAWAYVLKKDGGTTMVNVGPDGESDGPYTVEHLTESLPSGAVLVTVRVRWKDVPLGAPVDPTARTLEVLMSTQRAP